MSSTLDSIDTNQKTPKIKNLKTTVIRKHIKIKSFNYGSPKKITLMQLIQKKISQSRLELFRFFISKHLFYNFNNVI